ncbi:MAG TPA: heavy-metal-associated domain-containing protein [Acidimicrobiales bacterium]|nr:heavy-metal-associated domain-containing protein [Acidimicrobiales bacterium]
MHEQDSIRERHAMITRTFRVAEIHCGSCENTIRTSLSRIPGVAAVLPSAERNDVRVSFDDARVSEEQLREALAGVGFQPVS